MRRILFLLPLLMAGCSCQPESSRAPAGNPAPSEMPESDPSDPPMATGSIADDSDVAASRSVAAGALDEGAVVRKYLYALLGSDRTTSDSYWRGGSTGSRPDDQVLRVLPQLKSLRVDTAQPVARDTEQPSRLREVPVKVRALTAEGTLHYQGWYRLEPRADGSGWEITGASLQPVLR
jgi:hypothetical protein